MHLEFSIGIFPEGDDSNLIILQIVGQIVGVYRYDDSLVIHNIFLNDHIQIRHTVSSATLPTGTWA